MRLHRTGVVDVQHFISMCYQPVGHQHTVAAEVYAFGAHISGARVLSQRKQFGHRGFELRSQHVVGVIAEARIAKCEVGRIVANLFAVAAQSRHPVIPNSGGQQAFLQRFPIELRQAPRHGKGADIDQGSHLVRLKRRNQVVERARGMSDGIEGSQRWFDAEASGNDASKSGGDGDLLFGKDRPEIEQDAAFLDPSNDGSLRTAQALGEVVSAKAFARHRQNSGRKN